MHQLRTPNKDKHDDIIPMQQPENMLVSRAKGGPEFHLLLRSRKPRGKDSTIN
jgi:hypothetical protein